MEMPGADTVVRKGDNSRRSCLPMRGRGVDDFRSVSLPNSLHGEMSSPMSDVGLGVKASAPCKKSLVKDVSSRSPSMSVWFTVW